MQRSNNGFYAVTLILVIAFASFFVSWKLLIPKYQKNQLRLKTLELEIVKANEKLESLRLAKKDIEDLGLIYDQMYVAMPKDTDEPNVISELEALASVNSLSIPGIQINDSASLGSPSEAALPGAASNAVNISFSVIGTFENISKLTKSIEEDLKFMNIKNLTLSSSSAGIAASYQIEAYKAAGAQTFSSGTASSTNSQSSVSVEE